MLTCICIWYICYKYIYIIWYIWYDNISAPWRLYHILRQFCPLYTYHHTKLPENTSSAVCYVTQLPNFFDVFRRRFVLSSRWLHNSLVSVWIRLRLDDDLGSNPVMTREFIFRKTSRRGSGVHPAPYLVITGGCFLKLKGLGFVANHSSPSTADLKNIEAVHPVTLYAIMACIRIAILFDVLQAKISSLALCFETASIYFLRLKRQIKSYLCTPKGTRWFNIVFFRPKRFWTEYVLKFIQNLSPITA
jgi:hypothetical protein